MGAAPEAGSRTSGAVQTESPGVPEGTTAPDHEEGHVSPEELSAHIEITQVLYRYCRGVDRGDRELIRSVYHPDATDDHGSWSGLGVDFADHVVDSMDGATLTSQHQISNPLIEVDGDVASCESYFLAFHPSRNASGDEKLVVAAGRYLDRFECRAGEWRIADSRCTR